MSRWEPNARSRLADAALKLYIERGFEQTTVAEIAKEAGLTERTFFRHFADKREVLFSGTAELRELLDGAVAGTPESTAPMDAVAAALDAAGAALQPRHPHSRRRQAVIDANPELQERELLKLAALGSAVADALRRRGVADPTASLAAQTGMAVFKVAFERWVNSTGRADLPQLIRQSFDELRSVVSRT
jgi:AcrR family transcriptional regulator